MSSSGGNQGDVFEVRRIRRLIELMNEHDLAEIDLRQADQRIRLRRGPENVPLAPTPQAAVPVPPPRADGAAGANPPGQEPASAADATNIVLIKSPMVGTYYSAPSPDAPPFCKVGDHVQPESTVCIVEAMKVFNEIPAECAGRIVAVMVDNGDPVEFGQPLFRVDTRG